MTWAKILRQTAGISGHTEKDTSQIIRAFLSVISERLQEGHEVKLLEIGTFKLKEVKGKGVCHMNYNRVCFSPSKRFKDKIRHTKAIKKKRGFPDIYKYNPYKKKTDE